MEDLCQEDVLDKNNHSITCNFFSSDILLPDLSSFPEKKVDMIIIDVPYGNLVHWSGENGIDSLLENIKPCIKKDGVVVLVHDRYQKRTNQDFKRLEKFKVGKRVVEILKLES